MPYPYYKHQLKFRYLPICIFSRLDRPFYINYLSVALANVGSDTCKAGSKDQDIADAHIIDARRGCAARNTRIANGDLTVSGTQPADADDRVARRLARKVEVVGGDRARVKRLLGR